MSSAWESLDSRVDMLAEWRQAIVPARSGALACAVLDGQCLLKGYDRRGHSCCPPQGQYGRDMEGGPGLKS